jgi:hypothetical protein
LAAAPGAFFLSVRKKYGKAGAVASPSATRAARQTGTTARARPRVLRLQVQTESRPLCRRRQQIASVHCSSRAWQRRLLGCRQDDVARYPTIAVGGARPLADGCRGQLLGSSSRRRCAGSSHKLITRTGPHKGRHSRVFSPHAAGSSPAPRIGKWPVWTA